MNIQFETERLRAECNNTKLLKKQYGARMAEVIRRRLDDLAAAENLEAMGSLPGRCHELKGDKSGQLSLDLENPLRLIFMPSDFPPAIKSEGGIDRKNVRSVIIIGIEDTHE